MKRATLAGLLLALCGPPALAVVAPGIVGFQLAFCGIGVLVLVVVLQCERLPLSSIGLRRPDWSTLWTAALLVVCGLVLQTVVIDPLVDLVGRRGVEDGIRELAALPMWLRVWLAITAGVIEELLYRGYAIERLAALTGSRGWGATLATLAFAAGHIPAWGAAYALVGDLPAGILLAGFYLWRRDLVANMLAHSAGLLIAMATIGPPP